MGQAYHVVNVDKRQYLNPHYFGEGYKLLEFGCSSGGTMTALAILLANGNGRGGGDLTSNHLIVGSWAGDRIVVAGDYGDPGKWLDGVPPDDLLAVAKECFSEGYQNPGDVNLHHYAEKRFQNVSLDVIAAISDDQCERESWAERFASGGYMMGNEDGIKAVITARHPTFPKEIREAAKRIKAKA